MNDNPDLSSAASRLRELRHAGSVSADEVVQAAVAGDSDANHPFLIASAEGTVLYPGNGETSSDWLRDRLAKIARNETPQDSGLSPEDVLPAASSEQPLP